MDFFLLAQAVGAVAMTCAILQMQIKSSRTILFTQVPISGLWVFQYCLLGAPAGMVSNVLVMLRGLAILSKGFILKLCFWGLNLSYLTIGYFVVETWVDTLPLISGMIGNLVLLRDEDRKFMCRAHLTGSMLWHIYNITVGSWMGLACGLLIMASTIISMIRYEGLFRKTKPIFEPAE